MKIKKSLCVIFMLIVVSVMAGLYLLFAKKENPVILITIDTIRADYVGCLGSRFDTTPFIDTLAKDGILFANAFTPVPMTLPSHASILTGLYPMHHGVHGNGVYRLSPRVMTLAKLFKEHGYVTSAVVGSYILNSRYGLAEGFDVYKDQMNVQSDLPSENAQITADEVTKRSIEILQKMQTRKFFMWIHYFDPHTPYTPPREFYNKFYDPYAGEIAFVDSQIKLLFDKLNSTPFGKDALIIIIGDHGEGLGEHEENGHGYFLYNTTLKIPFIIKFPVSQIMRKKIFAEVITLDIFPTLCDYFNFRCEKYELEGKSLLPLIKQKSVAEFHESHFAETLMPQIDFGWAPLSALMKDGWKYIQAPQPELYHYAEKHNENENAYASDPERVKKYSALLKSWFDEIKKKAIDASVKIDAESMEKLQALGYIGGSLPRDRNASNVDVKDMKTTIKVLNDSTALLNTKHPEEAIAMVIDEIKRLEDMKKPAPFLYSIAAQYYASRGDYDKAISFYKKYLTMSPNFPDYYITLGKIYGNYKQDFPAAIDYLYSALKLDERIVEAYIYLGNYLVEMQRFDEADRIFKKGTSYFPDDYNLLNSYARLLSFTNKYDDALAALNHAVKVAPNLPDAYINSAIVYLSKGDLYSARQKIEYALKISPSHPLALEIQKQLAATR